MELRHLRYFVAVAEEGSLTLAAERRLHTAQPSLSRQIRDLETEVGARLLSRGARGITLTDAGKVFLDHARLALLQVEAARDAARRAAQPGRDGFVIGFLTGHEVIWLPPVLRALRQAAVDTEITIASQQSPELAAALMRGTIDVALLRREEHAPGLVFKPLTREPLVVVLPAAHRLAKEKAIRPRDIAGEVYVSPTKTAPALKAVIERYAREAGIALNVQHEADNISTVMSLVLTTGGVTLLPAYAEKLLSPLLVTRPLRGDPPTIELVIGYSRSNTSPVLKRFLARTGELTA